MSATIQSTHAGLDGYGAVDFIVFRNIPGAFVECGVASGTHPSFWARRLIQNREIRDIWLYDTFEGMTPPGKNDCSLEDGKRAIGDYWSPEKVKNFWESQQLDGGGNGWCRGSLEEVVANMGNTNYPRRFTHYVKGDVCETLKNPNNIPHSIALLRLDTDWYESTKAELEALYDRVTPGGLIIFDDYYYWAGQRKAVDDFFASRNITPTIGQVPFTQRGSMIKP